MPYKFTDDRRHKFDKKKYRLRNWAEYEEGLKNRGSLTIWFTEDAIKSWVPDNVTKKRGGQVKYSDLAIETALQVRSVYGLPLRQSEGFLTSIADLMGLDIEIPDHSTLSRRSGKLKVENLRRDKGEAVILIVDSTGLKMVGKGEWCEEKWGPCKRKVWRKLHLAIDESTGEILSSELTDNRTGDETILPDLVNAIDEDIEIVMGDGAYDTSDFEERFPGIIPIIPPRIDATISKDFDSCPSIRDSHIEFIDIKGRMSWQEESGYNKRCLVETTMGRYKKIIGPSLRSKNLDSQKVEAKIGCLILNKMTELGMPKTYRV